MTHKLVAECVILNRSKHMEQPNRPQVIQKRHVVLAVLHFLIDPLGTL